MPNLTLYYSGDMDITSAFISDDKVYLEYGRNNTGRITGWTYSVHNDTHPDDGKYYTSDYVTVIYTPHWSGTTRTETITVSGVDEGGTQRSDTAVLKQTPRTTLEGMSESMSTFSVDIYDFTIKPDRAEALYRITGVEGRTFYVRGRVGGYLLPSFEGVVSAPPVPITSLTLNVDSQIVDSGVATVSYGPSGADTMNIAYSSSDTSKATIDTNGNITVYGTGEVTICARDMVSGLQDCKTVSVVSTAPTSFTFTVYYNVTSTTEPTWIKYEDYAYWSSNTTVDPRPNTNTLSAMLENGTNVPLEPDQNGDIYFTFPETGIQKVIYTVDDRKIPSGAFSWHPGSPYPMASPVALEAPGIEEIGWDAFHNITSLTSITIPDVTYFGTGCFAGTGLVNLVIPSGVTEVGQAFNLNHSLETVVIHSGVTSIQGEGFDGCENLQYIRFLGETPPTLALCYPDWMWGSLGHYDLTFPIYVPCGAVNAYKAAYPPYAGRIVCANE